MVTKSSDHRTGTVGGAAGTLHLIGRIALRALQMIMALVLAAIYGIELSAYIDRHDGKPHSALVFLEVVAGLSIVTAAVLLLPLKRAGHPIFAWEAILFLFWTALFGTFATRYLHRQCAADDGNCRKMKATVWIDLFVALLWLISSVWNGITYWRERRSLGGPDSRRPGVV